MLAQGVQRCYTIYIDKERTNTQKRGLNNMMKNELDQQSKELYFHLVDTKRELENRIDKMNLVYNEVCFDITKAELDILSDAIAELATTKNNIVNALAFMRRSISKENLRAMREEHQERLAQ